MPLQGLEETLVLALEPPERRQGLQTERRECRAPSAPAPDILATNGVVARLFMPSTASQAPL